jgi:hypothetical protein
MAPFIQESESLTNTKDPILSYSEARIGQFDKLQ